MLSDLSKDEPALAADANRSKQGHTIFEILSSGIPNRIIKYDDRDPPWITSQLKTAINVNIESTGDTLRGKNHDDWYQVKTIRNETSRMIVNAKKQILPKFRSRAF